MDATPAPETEQETEVSVDEVVSFVVKNARKHKKALIIGGAVLLNVIVIKKFRAGAKAVEDAAAIGVNSVRIYQGAYGTDSYDISLMINGADLRRELGYLGIITAATPAKK